MERYVVFHEGIQIEAIKCRPHGLQFASQCSGIAFQCPRGGATSDFLQGGPDIVRFILAGVRMTRHTYARRATHLYEAVRSSSISTG
jgi:hypothetical protein